MTTSLEMRLTEHALEPPTFTHFMGSKLMRLQCVIRAEALLAHVARQTQSECFRTQETLAGVNVMFLSLQKANSLGLGESFDFPRVPLSKEQHAIVDIVVRNGAQRDLCRQQISHLQVGSKPHIQIGKVLVLRIVQLRELGI